MLGADGRLAERRLVTNEQIWAWEEFGYDEIGRQHSHTVHRFPVTAEPDLSDPDSLTTTTEYFDEEGPKQGLVHWIEDPLTRRTYFDYDDAGREVRRELPDGSVVETTYYPDGKVHTRTVRVDGDEPWSLTTATLYDDQGRVHQVIDPGGRTTTTRYDELGRKESVLSPDSVPAEGGEELVARLTRWDYGDLGRVVTETRPDGARITRTYDERGNLVAYADDGGNTTTYRYYLNGRLKAIVYPDGTERSFSYYPDGEMLEITRADGTVVTFEIDETTGRLKTIDADAHQPGGDVSFGYDPVGHLTTAADEVAALTFGWDSVGNQLSESLALPDLGFGERTLTRAFDDGNRPTQLAMPDELPALVRGYDDGDRLDSLKVGGAELWSARYDGGRLTRIDRANGLATALAYDGEGRPVEVATGVPGADGLVSAPIHRLGLGWTHASLRRSKAREDTRRLVERFHYDGVGHLESDLDDNTAAVAGFDADLASAVPDLEPRPVEEWWTVNRVDELTTRRRVDEGRQADYQPQHDADGLHQVVRSGNFSYDWDDNGNLAARHLMEGGTAVATDIFSHDWRDRLVEVTHGDTTTSLVVDPLGRLVAKVEATPDGDVARIYLHDGDQVVAEYVQEAGGTAWQVERRHHWGRWIDDLAVEEVDTDGDGILDRSLWPVTDLLGSVQLLTDAGGRIVERIEYATDGTPRFFAEDATPPTATRVAWTGDGLRPAGDTVASEVFEIGFDEWLGDASVDAATATLTPDGGEAVELEVALDADGRGITLAGADVEVSVTYALHLDGLRDRSGNDMWPLDLSFTVADADVYETLLDASPPAVLAVIDAADGLYVLFDEPVVATESTDLGGAVTVVRSGAEILGTTERLGAQLLKWTAEAGAAWYPQQRYQITTLEMQDIAPTPSAVTVMPGPFSHLATYPEQTLVAWSAPDHSERLAESRYGQTSLFQGRTWHEELGLYDYRARWYGPDIGCFMSRDPFGGESSESYFQFLRYSTPNFLDPRGFVEKTPTPAMSDPRYYTDISLRESFNELAQKHLLPPNAYDYEFYFSNTDKGLEIDRVVRMGDMYDFGLTYRIAIMGGIARWDPAIINPFSFEKNILLGNPDYNLPRAENSMWQTLRLAQAIKIFHALTEIYPEVLEKKYRSMYPAKYRSSHNIGSRFLLNEFARFRIPRQYWLRALSAIVSGIHNSEVSEESWNRGRDEIEKSVMKALGADFEMFSNEEAYQRGFYTISPRSSYYIRYPKEK